MPGFKVGKGGNSDAVEIPVGTTSIPILIDPVPSPITPTEVEFPNITEPVAPPAPVLGRPLPVPLIGPTPVPVKPDGIEFPDPTGPIEELAPVIRGPIPVPLGRPFGDPDPPLLVGFGEIPVPVNPGEVEFSNGAEPVAELAPKLGGPVPVPPETPV